ncbi:MAG: hypothetical protein ACQERU_12455, partial [Bacteroidota bacterium]
MKKLTILTLLLIIGLGIFAQENKKPLTFDDILKWNRITETLISNDGNTIVYKSEPWKGDPIIKITGKDGDEIASLCCATNALITNDSKFVVFTIKPSEETIRELKLKKTKKEDMPQNKLGIYHLENNDIDTICNFKSFKLPEKWDGWLAYQIETEIVKDTNKVESEDEKEQEIKKESKKNGFKLVLKNLNTSEEIEIPFVTDYHFAEENKFLTFISTGTDDDFNAGVYLFDINQQIKTNVLLAKGDYKQLTINKTG